MKHKILLIVFSILYCESYAQENKTTFGLQYKPIIAVAYFDASNNSKRNGDYLFNLKPNFSYSLGMVIRQKINHTFSIESGLNYIQRNFRLSILRDNTIYIDDFTDFKMRAYEIPVQLLAYVQTNERWYVNASFGYSYNTLASNIFSNGISNQYFYQNTFRRKSSYFALLANVGLEYRTYEKGNYYFGTSLHRPFKEIARVYPSYDQFNTGIIGENHFYLEMLGNFISIDFRYFFAK